MHDDVKELLSLRAIGALDGDDRDRLDEHVALGCAECGRELVDLERVGALIGWAAEPASPPASLRARVLDAVADDRDDSYDRDPRRRPAEPIPISSRARTTAPSAPRPGALAAAFGLLAAASIAIFVLVSWLVSVRSDLDTAVRQLADARTAEQSKNDQIAKQQELLGVVDDPDVRFVRLSDTNEPAKPGVDVAWNPKQLRGMLYARGLPHAAAGKAYELWLIAEGAPVPAVVFNTDSHGNAAVEIGKLPPSLPKVFAITVEPEAGSQAPTSKPILAGNYGA